MILSTKKAYMAWRECIAKDIELRDKLAVQQDRRETYTACRDYYKIYMKKALYMKRKELDS